MKHKEKELTGLFVDAGSIVAGSLIGLLLQKGISKKISDAIMIGIGLCVVYMGISGLTKDVGTILLLFSVIIGTLIGTAVDIDGKVNAFGLFLERKFAKKEDDRFAKGFVTYTILSCTGAYTIMASLNAGLGDSAMLYTKAIIDFSVAMMLSSTLGIGVMFSCISVSAFQGVLALFSGALSPLLSEQMIGAFSCVGALLTIPIGTNMMGVTDIKIANYLPAVFAAPVIVWILTLIG